MSSHITSLHLISPLCRPGPDLRYSRCAASPIPCDVTFLPYPMQLDLDCRFVCGQPVPQNLVCLVVSGLCFATDTTPQIVTLKTPPMPRRLLSSLHAANSVMFALSSSKPTASLRSRCNARPPVPTTPTRHTGKRKQPLRLGIRGPMKLSSRLTRLYDPPPQLLLDARPPADTSLSDRQPSQCRAPYSQHDPHLTQRHGLYQ